jgi:hypothetical protein
VLNADPVLHCHALFNLLTNAAQDRLARADYCAPRAGRARRRAPLAPDRQRPPTGGLRLRQWTSSSRRSSARVPRAISLGEVALTKSRCFVCRLILMRRRARGRGHRTRYGQRARGGYSRKISAQARTLAARRLGFAQGAIGWRDRGPPC